MELKIFKIGGNIVDNPEKLDKFLKDFISVKGAKILVHGGGKVATTISKALGIETQMIDGRRVTDKQTLDVVTMVYAGLVNKNIVAKLNAMNCSSIGLCGADGGLIKSQRRSPKPIDFGFVGDPLQDGVNIQLVKQLIKAGQTLVIAPITCDVNGTLLNTNADTIAQSIAVAMSSIFDTELIYCFEKQGVLADVNDENSVIAEITRESYAEFKRKGIVADGMLPKLDNSFKAIEEGVEAVIICSAEAVTPKGISGGTRLIR